MWPFIFTPTWFIRWIMSEQQPKVPDPLVSREDVSLSVLDAVSMNDVVAYVPFYRTSPIYTNTRASVVLLYAVFESIVSSISFNDMSERLIHSFKTFTVESSLQLVYCEIIIKRCLDEWT